MRARTRVGGALILITLLVGALTWRAKTPWIPSSISWKHRSDIRAIQSACEEYAIDHDGAYPSNLTDLAVRVPGRRPYLAGSRPPLDPWGRPYRYEAPRGQNTSPRIWTHGRDDLPGGEGEDTDIGNWLWRD